MASTAKIRECFGLLVAAGTVAPRTWTDGPATAEGDADRRNARAGTLRIWEAVFTDASDEEIVAAVTVWLGSTTTSWWPLPGQVRAHLRSVQATSRQIGQALGPDEAWGYMLALVTRFGSYRPPVTYHDDPASNEALTRALRAIGGWSRLCSTTADDFGTPAAFRRAFTAVLEQSADTQRAGGIYTAIEADSARRRQRLLAQRTGDALTTDPKEGET